MMAEDIKHLLDDTQKFMQAGYLFTNAKGPDISN
jgi:hypothetical protein